MVLGYEMFRILTNPTTKKFRLSIKETYQKTLIDPGKPFDLTQLFFKYVMYNVYVDATQDIRIFLNTQYIFICFQSFAVKKV